ncbi:hypothetical protein K2173_023138 [Erythroxylum novogranatense]|uniref:Fe2OG dioxygenase domain-containing protein n=1 Tax=Erythroxylum novogranatense TaxID=1862640 RepID=A0AAV8UAN5_9ROSI|nr:hypothetical protein K2173_023138 [Erythroxylum novogranatense]
MEFEVVRVQSLSESNITEVPSQYIQPPENRPRSKFVISGSLEKANGQDDAHLRIPVIDLFGFDAEQRESVREAIGEACRLWGAFYVTNHGVALELLDSIRSVGRSFFEDCSIDEKLRYACDPNSAASQGYGSKMLTPSPQQNETVVLDWRDYFDHHTLPMSRRDPSRWPQFPANYREVVSQYSDQMKVLAEKLLGLISESMELPTSSIQEAVGDFYQNITISYYPPCPRPDLTLGLQSHSDMGAITLLIQDDVPGLQVLKDFNWITVPPRPYAILVLLADQTEIITNGICRSCEHRAITNSTRARLSVATFHDPAKTVKVSPALELVTESSPARYGEVGYGDYVSSWYSKGPDGKRNIDALRISS